MRKKITAAAIVLLCITLLAACTNKSDLVGVYTSESSAQILVLHEDGTAEYADGGDWVWETNGKTVTLRLQQETQYLRWVYLDPAVLSEAEMKAVCTQINTIENVKSTDFSLNVIFVQLEAKDPDNTVAKQSEQIKGVISVECSDWEPEPLDYELEMQDGDLILTLNYEPPVVFEKTK